MQPASPDRHLGRSIARYRLTRILGEGGMGVVFEATHEMLGRRAAVKILLPHCSLQPDLLRRFFDEARAANLLEHPSLVQIFECGQLDDGTAYLIMEFLNGRSLRSRLKPDGLAPAEVSRIGSQIAEALAAAHVKGIVHRDLKPENLMLVFDPAVLNRERIKVLDFGIAKLIDDRPQHLRTDAKVVMGTPAYMSPEQCMGAGLVSFPSDVYSLGVILYEMVIGRPPFEGDGHGAIMFQHVSSAIPSLPAGPQSDSELNGLILSMLVKDAELRPTMTAVATQLEQMAMAYAMQSSPTPRSLRSVFKQRTQILSTGLLGAPVRQQSLRTYLLLAGFLTLVLGGALLLLGHEPQKRQSPPDVTTSPRPIPTRSNASESASALPSTPQSGAPAGTTGAPGSIAPVPQQMPAVALEPKATPSRVPEPRSRAPVPTARDKGNGGARDKRPPVGNPAPAKQPVVLDVP